jgi:hypothetical protein
LEDKLLDEAIAETGTVPYTDAGGNETSQINVEEQLIEEIRGSVVLSTQGTWGTIRSEGRGGHKVDIQHLNGLQSLFLSKNKKLEKAQWAIDDLQADIVCCDKHWQNPWHKSNRNGFQQIFNGGEMKVQTNASNNVSEEARKFQEVGTAMMIYGNQIQQFDSGGSRRNDLGMGC